MASISALEIPARAASLVRVALTGLDETGKDESVDRFWTPGLEMELPGMDGLGRGLSEYTEKDLTGFLAGSGFVTCTFAEVWRGLKGGLFIVGPVTDDEAFVCALKTGSFSTSFTSIFFVRFAKLRELNVSR